MQVFLNNIMGTDDAIQSMFMSKRTWTPELREDIITTCDKVLNRRGFLNDEVDIENKKKFEDWMAKLARWGWQHSTMCRFISVSFSVQGLHRAGQDDWDSHAKRFDNRIIRSSTRLATFGSEEMSDYYKGKIIPTDMALAILGVTTPETIEYDGKKYIKGVNGYILEEYKDSKDVKRGLYMLSIPSDFVFTIQLTEFGHVYRERNELGTANPEVKIACEEMLKQITNAYPMFDRDFFMKIKT